MRSNFKLGVAGNRTIDPLYDLIPRAELPEGLAIVPRIGEWQHARIVAWPDGRVEHWLNGIKVVGYVRGSPLFEALVARSRFEKIADFGMAPRGRILLQDHGDEVHFRSIKLRELKRADDIGMTGNLLAPDSTWRTSASSRSGANQSA